MTVSAPNQMVTVRDLLAGEVWVCSGQSNMQMSVSASLGADEELPRANDPQLRLFKIPRIASNAPVPDVNARWLHSSSSSAAPFSAVGYYFAKELRSKLKVPVGIIMAAWGGTIAEVWTDLESLVADGGFAPILSRWKERLARDPAMLRIKSQGEVGPKRKKDG